MSVRKYVHQDSILNWLLHLKYEIFLYKLRRNFNLYKASYNGHWVSPKCFLSSGNIWYLNLTSRHVTHVMFSTFQRIWRQLGRFLFCLEILLRDWVSSMMCLPELSPQHFNSNCRGEIKYKRQIVWDISKSESAGGRCAKMGFVKSCNRVTSSTIRYSVQ